MNDLLLKIYEGVIRHEEKAIGMKKRISEEVDRITKPYEGLQDLLFDISLVVEHEGFKLGMKFFAKLLTECLS